MAETYNSLAELGAELAASRSAREVSLQSMSTMTCIRTEVLQGMEQGVFPEGATTQYILSLVRSYINLIQRQDLWPHYERLLKGEKPIPEPLSQPLQPDASSRHFETFGDEIIEPKPALKVEPAGEFKPFELKMERSEAPSFTPVMSSGMAAEEPRRQAPVPDFEAAGPALVENPLTTQQAQVLVEEATAPRRRTRVQPSRKAAPVVTAPSRPHRVPRSDSPKLMNELSRADDRPRRRGGFGGLVLLLLTLAVIVLVGWLGYKAFRVLWHGDAPTASRSVESEDLGALVVPGAVPSAKESEGENTLPTVSVVAGTTTRPEASPSSRVEPQASSEPAPSVAETGKKGTFTVRVKGGECWIAVKSGNKTLFAKVMKSGEEKTLDMTGPIRVEYGAAQHATVSVDGGEFKPAGDGVLRTTYQPAH